MSCRLRLHPPKAQAKRNQLRRVPLAARITWEHETYVCVAHADVSLRVCLWSSVHRLGYLPSTRGEPPVSYGMLDHKVTHPGRTLLLFLVSVCLFWVCAWWRNSVTSSYLSAWQAARERAQALELRGRCYIHLGDFELAGNHFRQVRDTTQPKSRSVLC